MIPCPSCGSKRNRVGETRSRGKALVRYRVCAACSSRFATIETLRDAPQEAPTLADAMAEIRRSEKAILAALGARKREPRKPIPPEKADDYKVLRSKGYRAAEARSALGID